jgi:hypothetical protein
VHVVGSGDHMLDDVNVIPLVYFTSAGDRMQRGGGKRDGGAQERLRW